MEELDFSNARIVVPGAETEEVQTTEMVTDTAEVAGDEAATVQSETHEPETPALQEETVAETDTPEIDTTPQESPEETFSRVFKDKYGYDSVEDYLAAQAPEEKAPAYSDTIKKLIEWESKGLKPEDYFQTQAHNFDEMSELDRVRNHLAIENPDWTPDDINLFLEDEFKLNEDEYSEREVKLGQLRLKQRAKEITPKLKEWQTKAATPVEDTSRQEAEAQLKAYHSLVDDQLKDFKSFDIPLNDKGEKFTYSIEADKKGLEAMVKDVNAFFSDFIATDATGKPTYKIKEMAKAFAWAKNGEKIAKAIAAQAKSKGVAQVEKELNNVPDPSKKDKPAVEDNSPMGQLSKLASAGLL